MSGAIVSGSFFQILGTRAAMGRLFTPDDDRTPGAHPVAVLSNRLWRRLGTNPAIAGSPLRVTGGVSEVHHGGDSMGYSGVLYLQPANKLGVAVLTNLELLDSQVRVNLARQIAEIVKAQK